MPGAPAVEVQVSGLEAHPTSQAQPKEGSSQPGPHVTSWHCHDPVCSLASEDPSGDIQGFRLAEPKPAGLGVPSEKVLCLLPRIRFSAQPRVQEKWSQDGKGWGAER